MKPFVYWAQTESDITIRVDVKDVVQDSAEVVIEEEEIEVTATGIGAQGGLLKRNYHFVIEFFLPVDKEASSFQVLDSGIQISLKKKDKDWWPRLLYQQQKLAWLKIDFDRWKNPDGFDDSEDEAANKANGGGGGGGADDPFGHMRTEDLIRNKYPDLYKDLEKDELGFVSESTKKVYLFCYNLFMFTCFLYIFCVLNIRYAKLGHDFVNEAFGSVGGVVKMVHLMMILEVLHPVFGYTKGSVFNNAVHVGRRLLILFVLIDSESRMQTKPVVCYLLAIWTVLELFRYPYYMLRVYNINLGLLTWLRYTVWIPLFPAGFVCEGVIALRDIPYFEETEKFSVLLPNPYNLSFYLPNILRVYLLFLFFPSMYAVMQNFYQVRCKKLNIRQHSINKKAKED